MSNATKKVMHGIITKLPLPKFKNLTALEYFQEINIGTFNVNPVGQRISTDNKTNTKATNILVAVVNGADLGELCYRSFEKYVKEVAYEIWEIIDGSHRSRMIVDFFSNKLSFPKVSVTLSNGTEMNLGGLFYKDLPQELKKYFNDYPIRICYYENITPSQAAVIFHNRNQSTPVNHQEMMNAYSDNLVAIPVREFVRAIPDHKPEYVIHPLFSLRTITKKKTGELEVVPAFLNFENKRLIWDRHMIVNLIYAIKGGLTNASDEDIEYVYDHYGDEEKGVFKKDPDALEDALDRVRGCLDFVLEVAKAYIALGNTKGLDVGKVVMLTRYYWWLKSQSDKKNFKLANPTRFAKAVTQSIFELTGKTGGSNSKPPSDKWLNTFVATNLVTEREPVPVPFKMREWMSGYFAVSERVIQTCKWLDEALEDYRLNEKLDDIGLIFKDSKRSLSKKDCEYLLASQGWVCFIDGLPLTLDEAEAGHIIPHSDGGLTTIENCKMIRKEHNRKMGSMNLYDYKAWWDSKHSHQEEK